MTNSTDIKNTRKKILFIVQFSVLLAIEAIFCFTPLGSIPVGPIVATTAMIPVIITSFLLGTPAGSAMGFFAGLFSFIVMTFVNPGPMSLFFTPFFSFGELQGNFMSLIICFVPRILVGTVTGVCYKFFSFIFAKKEHTKNIFAYGVAAALGSFINTVLVLGGIYVFFSDMFAQAFEMASNLVFGVIMGIVLTNGVPELILSGIVGYLVCRPLKSIFEKRKIKGDSK